MAALLPTTTVVAQTCPAHRKQYEFIPLGTFSTSVSADSLAFGINDLGEVVGAAQDDGFVFRAALWLYCPNYDEAFPAKTLIDLTAAAEQSGLGIARDISNAGVVVGNQIVSTNDPFVWRLPLVSGNPSAWTVHIEPGDFESAEAYAVNDANPPTLVGRVVDPALCGSPPTASPGPLAFSYVLGDSDLTLDDDNLLPGFTGATEALDINTASPVRVGGGTLNCSALGGGNCFENDNAATWTLSPDDSALLPDSGTSYGSKSNAINGANMAAGWYRVGDTACKQHACWWWGPSAAPFDLHSVGTWEALDQSEALGMSDSAVDGSVWVVGTSISQNRAALWHRGSTGTWSLTALNCEVSSLCEWTLTHAYDVNADGWIVGYGFIDDIPTKQRAFLLRPIELAGDVNYDCAVDSTDLGLLLAAWGSAPSSCNFDLYLDGVVDSADLGILLSDWGQTCVLPCGSSESLSSPGSGESAMASALIAALGSLGFNSIAEFNAWAEAASADKSGAVLMQLAALLLK